MILSGTDVEMVREVWNGAWFALTLSMIVCMSAIAIDRMIKLLQRGERRFYCDPAIQICAALIVFCAGSGMRAGYIWVLLHCQNFDAGSCDEIEHAEWLMSIAGVLAIVGGICTIRVMSPTRWRPWSWMAAGAFAVGVPLVYYTLDLPLPPSPKT